MSGTASVAHLIPRSARIPELGTLLERIRAVYAPDEVLLFGSRARGTARRDSDWDLLVLLPDGADARLLDPLLGYETQAGSGVYADVLCSFTREFLADATVANSRTREIVDHAVRLGAR